MGFNLYAGVLPCPFSMTSLAYRTLSARVCSQCRRQNLQRSSTRQQSNHAATSSFSPPTSTYCSNLVSSLYFEASQAKPSQHRIWSKLNELCDLSPSSLQPSLLYEVIPSLSTFRQLPKTSQLHGTGRLIAITEEAEALYSRYRFLSNRLAELGEKPLDDRSICIWLDGLQKLSYAPAAWRIWEDCARHTETLGRPVSKTVARQVLITMAKWLAFQNRIKGPANHTASMREVRCFVFATKFLADGWCVHPDIQTSPYIAFLHGQ